MNTTETAAQLTESLTSGRAAKVANTDGLDKKGFAKEIYKAAKLANVKTSISFYGAYALIKATAK